ncbi:3-keto-5-aminohexanoate cleavage protein [Aureimonas sp. ME7]|uniref:3-keto-5-aminohexanoate cleavage protein n=1 Tax=Aureimonas sp. ME7 TaxID=2744252 RepID=UPI0015F8AF22|nr:3-keto-5-aminohexanoate cleavage protein [Aureimonas sp. ME7]
MVSPKRKTVITCAVTGNLTTRDQTPYLPVTPGEIATACLEAAKAGAAIVHIHVRDPETGRPSMALEHYREVVERIRDENSQIIINLTTGPGGRFMPGDPDPAVAGPGTTLTTPKRRVAHVVELKPDICTLDLNTMTFGREVVINTPASIRRMAALIADAGVLPEIELFDTGDTALLGDLVADGTLGGQILCSLVLGVRYGFPATPETLLHGRSLLPKDSVWTAFGVGRNAFAMVAQSYLAGGHVRIGLEDAVYLEEGVHARSNALMVEKARRIVELLGGTVATCEEARAAMGLG